MTFIVTRLCCALLSAFGAAGLVVFANPDNGLGITQGTQHAAAIAAVASSASAHRG